MTTRPSWASTLPLLLWARVDVLLRRAPDHAADAVADLDATVTGWDRAARTRLVERFAHHAEAGEPLPAAYVRALDDLASEEGRR